MLNLFYNSPEASKRDIFPTKAFGSVEKLPSDKPVPESGIKGKSSATHCSTVNNEHARKDNNQTINDEDIEGRPRTHSLGEKGWNSKFNESNSKNNVSPKINKLRPGHNHASSTGMGGTVVGTCNENFFKPLPKKTLVNDSPPVTNIISQAAKVKLRRFRVESSDR